MNKAIFENLIYDADDHPLQVATVGDEVFYVYDDNSFLRHIPAAYIDRQVWDALTANIEGNEDVLSQETARMLGQEDPFSIAIIRSQFENKDKQFEQLQQSGLPQDYRMYLGMVGFQIVVNHHGDVIEVKQPASMTGPEEE